MSLLSWSRVGFVNGLESIGLVCDMGLVGVEWTGTKWNRIKWSGLDIDLLIVLESIELGCIAR